MSVQNGIPEMTQAQAQHSHPKEVLCFLSAQGSPHNGSHATKDHNCLPLHLFLELALLEPCYFSHASQIFMELYF
jgi:hypothetical protein